MNAPAKIVQSSRIIEYQHAIEYSDLLRPGALIAFRGIRWKSSLRKMCQISTTPNKNIFIVACMDADQISVDVSRIPFGSTVAITPDE